MSTKPLEYYPTDDLAPASDIGPATFSLQRPGGGNASVNGSSALSAGGRRRMRRLSERVAAHGGNVQRQRGSGRSLAQLALNGVPLVERNSSEVTQPGAILGGVEHRMWGCAINHTPEQFPDRSPLVVPMGTIQEWNVTNLMLHSLHLHVNPYQIVDLIGGENLTNYWMVRACPPTHLRHCWGVGRMIAEACCLRASHARRICMRECL